MLGITLTIHALGEAQKEIDAFVKELKNSIPRPSEKASNKNCTPRENASQEKLAAIAGKGSEKAPSFVTQEDVIAMLENELHRSLHANDYNLRLREFSKRLIDRANTWYTTLTPGSIRTWEELASMFYKKNLTLDCYNEKDDEALVKICISNIVADYKVYSENIRISQFSRLLEVVMKTSLSIKPSTGKSCKTDEKKAHPSLACSDEEFQATKKEGN
ncbi:hypothetical protein C1H46_000070 [Malus baccata]|uniref:Retrotransposon gag domain-containing protein n=1 Tax=Malus baccata TaxID=106549 RepID=A0A540NSY8_MALBA|nr:hypothetical protein C1H46_000070 [Malus baccata]